MKNIIINNIVILISSHSTAYDFWKLTYYFQKKYWKNVNVFLGANGEDRRNYVPEEWVYINKGKDISFSKSLMSYIEEIEEDYFILMLDDFIILEKVNNDLIYKAFEFIKSKKGVYLRLTPNPKGDIKINKYFSMIDVKANVPYITSLQMAIWNKNFLKKLLEYDFSPWEFEVKGGKTNEAIENCNKFYVTNFPFIKYTHFVEKGKFYPFIKELLKKEGIILNSNRKFLSENELKKLKGNKIKTYIRKLIPQRYYNSLRKIMGLKEL